MLSLFELNGLYFVLYCRRGVSSVWCLPPVVSEVGHHGLHGRHGLRPHGADLRGREDEAVAAGVGQLDGVGVGDPRPAVRPVVAAACRWVKHLGSAADGVATTHGP